MCVVVTKITETRTCCAATGEQPIRTYCIAQTYRREEYYYENKRKSLCNWP